MMSDSEVCPYCGARIMISGPTYQEARMIKCPNCGASFRHVPGFGVLAEGIRRQSGGPPEISQPKTRIPHGVAYGPEIVTPSMEPASRMPQKEFDQTEECIKGCALIFILCVAAILILMLTMLAVIL